MYLTWIRINGLSTHGYFWQTD